MNARNLRYIRTKNSSESVSLADSKLKTKRFLSSRGIPFAETYRIITSQQELKLFSLKSIEADDFVIKPNKGSGGRGILIVKREEDGYSIQDELWTDEDINLHMIDILHGSFSLYGSDKVVIEELLTPGEEFTSYCRHGLADIRIIVYNYVPVTAMIRMPTASSGGKANLAQWWVWLGLNIANGQVISLFQNKKSYTGHFPPEYASLQGKMLPYWDEILLYSSQIQVYTKLGYLALDWVITKNGPKLLEINARAWLEIQNVNLVPLSARLRKIEDLKILSPEKWVEIAKALFQTDTISDVIGKKVVYKEQKGYIGDHEITLLVDLNKNDTFVSSDILEHTGDPIAITSDSQVNISVKSYKILNGRRWVVILGSTIMEEYLISPKKYIDEKPQPGTEKWTEEILSFDERVHTLSKRLNLSSFLKPDNYFQELDRFIEYPTGYNPVFEYHFPDDEKTVKLSKEIEQLEQEWEALKKNGHIIADLYIEKIWELRHKLLLLNSYKNEDFERILSLNKVLFWETNEALLESAKEKVGLIHTLSSEKINEMLGRVLTLEEVTAAIYEYFDAQNIKKIPISIEAGNLSRMSVSYGKSVKIHVAKNSVIRENEIPAILSHEIGTHFRRYLSGKQTGLKLFEYGTGYYLSDEEWLAIYRSFEHLPEGYEKNAMYLKYYLLSLSDTLSFSETVELLRTLSPGKMLDSIFSDAVRLKRGTIHTGVRWIPGTTYQKDKIYLDGYARIKNWLESGGDMEKLFYGKIKIADLKILETL